MNQKHKLYCICYSSSNHFWLEKKKDYDYDAFNRTKKSRQIHAPYIDSLATHRGMRTFYASQPKDFSSQIGFQLVARIVLLYPIIV